MKARKICALCLEEKPLRNSHLVPSGVYRLVGKAGTQIPIQMARGSVSYISKEVATRFLCGGCEQRFEKNGETPLLRTLCQPNGGFLLLDQVRALPCIDSREGGSVHEVTHEFEPTADSLYYYSLSYVWRSFAGAGEWPGIDPPQKTLGPYEEKMREFLLGVTGPPKGIALFVEVHSDGVEWPTASLVDSGRAAKSMHVHQFSVPGATFTLFLGNKLTRESENIAVNLGPQRVIAVTRFEKSGRFQGMLNGFGKSVVRGKLKHRSALEER